MRRGVAKKREPDERRRCVEREGGGGSEKEKRREYNDAANGADRSMRDAVDVAVVATYYTTLVLLTIYGLHRIHLVRLLQRVRHDGSGTWMSRARGELAQPELPSWPEVTVQLPIYNEPNVVVRLIDAAAALRYPGILQVQVLDDSTDATSSIIAERVAHWACRGVRIEQIRRESRDGFKAGALANGLARSTGDFFLLFDADFVPPPDLLLQMMPYLGDERVGMVQARWGHLNRGESVLTRVQAIYLDGHFAVESTGRYFGRRLFNFNGTAGIWRRQAILDAGGWSASTLTEDLDLSYRAQLAGWEFVFLPEIEVPAELPSTLAGFQCQQHRWAKGSIQTARKILPEILRASLPRAQKIESFFHLTNNAAYLLTLVLALLLVPALEIRYARGLSPTLFVDAALFALSTSSLVYFYAEGQRRLGLPRLRLGDLISIVPLGVGMSVRNAAAVLEGLFERGGYFARTPKRGATTCAAASETRTWPIGEAILAAFYGVAATAFIAQGYVLALPFVALFFVGYCYVVARWMMELCRAIY